LGDCHAVFGRQAYRNNDAPHRVDPAELLILKSMRLFLQPQFQIRQQNATLNAVRAAGTPVPAARSSKSLSLD
jgi:hypothetical protein